MAVSGVSGGGGKSKAIEAGEAFVKLSARDAGLQSALEKNRLRVLKFGSVVAKAGLGLITAGATGLAAFAGVFTAAVNRGTEFATIAKQLGSSVESVSSLAYAFETVGIAIDETRDTMKDLVKNISAASAGGGPAEAFRQIGVNAKALMGLPLDEQYAAIADGLAGIKNPADRARLAMEILGEGGLKLVPVLAKGGAELRRLAAEGRELGSVMDNETAAKSEQVSKSFTRAWNAMKFAVLSVGEALLPQADSIEDVAKVIVDVAKSVRGFISENKQLILIVVGVAAAIVAGGIALVGIGTAISIVATAVGGLVTAFGVLSTVLGFIFSGPGALIIAAVIAAVGVVAVLGYGLYELSRWFLTCTESGKAFGGLVGQVFGFLGETFRETWGGIVDAIRAGDLSLALNIAVAGLNVIWKGFLVALQAGWNVFKGLWVDGWETMKKTMSDVFDDLVYKSKMAWLQTKALVKNTEAEMAELRAKREEDRRASDADFAAQMQARKDARQADLFSVFADLAEAKKELARLVGEAANKAGAKKGGEEFKSPAGLNMAALADVVKGVFAAPNYRQVFGGASAARERQRELMALDKTAENTDEMIDLLKNLEPKFA
jgi:hypothetical protein